MTPITQISKNASHKKNGNCLLNPLQVLEDSVSMCLVLLVLAAG